MAASRNALLCFCAVALLSGSKFENLFDLSCEELKRNVICEQLECNNGKLVESGSLCGVCPVCVTYLDENEPCDLDSGPPGGVPSTTCGPDFKCERNRCRKKDSGCLEDAEHRSAMIKEGFFEGTWIPSCRGEEYKAKQCKEQKCFCLGENGERIFGQMLKYLADNMTCACSLAMFHMQSATGKVWMTEPHEYCALDGNYEELQCVGKVCFCADPITGMHKGHVTHIDYFMLLPCYQASKHGKFYLTECERIAQRSRLLAHQFFQKGININGLDEVACDFDGSFAKTQCLPDSCICTDRSGNKYKSYAMARYHLNDLSSMLCNCARDEYDRDTSGAQYSQLQCTSEGNYAPHQRVEGEKFCVDEDGEIIFYINDNVDLADECNQKRKLLVNDDDDYDDYDYDNYD